MDFNQRVWNVCKRIPKGKISTYKEIAKSLNTKAYRAVGNALNKNPHGAWGWVGGKGCRRQRCLVPCHRVINSDGKVGGFASGSKKKIAILRKEGIEIRNNKIDLKRYLFKL
jgi:methylated-DNA-[protein]-cysteine S-methyltransferase